MKNKSYNYNYAIKCLLEADSYVIGQVLSFQNDYYLCKKLDIFSVCGISNGLLLYALSYSFAEAYAMHGAKTIILDFFSNGFLSKELIKQLEKNKGERFSSETKNVNDIPTTFVYASDSISVAFVENSLCFFDCLQRDGFKNYIHFLKTNYDHVIFVIQQPMDSNEIMFLKNYISGVVVVTQRNATKKRDFFNLTSFLNKKGIELLKVVLIR